jgi:hypothetical protein
MITCAAAPINTSVRLRGELGVRMLVVDALDAKVARFYRTYGFRATATQALTLYLPLGKYA